MPAGVKLSSCDVDENGVLTAAECCDGNACDPAEQGLPILAYERAATLPTATHSCVCGDASNPDICADVIAGVRDPDDPDDTKWTARRLERFRKELDKKRAGRSLKQREKRDHRRTRCCTRLRGHDGFLTGFSSPSPHGG